MRREKKPLLELELWKLISFCLGFGCFVSTGKKCWGMLSLELFGIFNSFFFFFLFSFCVTSGLKEKRGKQKRTRKSRERKRKSRAIW